MSTTRSARAKFALGATLIVLCGHTAASTDGSSVQGIELNGLTGISSNGVTGISSNGLTGISSNGVTGISSNGTTGISSNGLTGISLNGVTGISSNGVTGISSNGKTGTDLDGLLDLSAGVLLAGPVDSIDRINGVFESMGQIVLASQSMLQSMQVGDYVTVAGSVVSSGWYYADAVEVSDQSYVPGATEVFVAGLVSSVDKGNGTAQLGDLTIDYTSSLGSGDAPSDVMWSFHGTRPSQDGKMISHRTAEAVSR